MRMDRFADELKDHLRHLADVMERRQRRDNVTLGLTSTQVRALSELLDEEAMPPGVLADKMSLAPSTVTRICDVLVRKGLVARKQAQGDRRRVHLSLTAPGFRTARELDRWEAAAIDRIATGISSHRRNELLENLELLVHALQADLPGESDW